MQQQMGTPLIASIRERLAGMPAARRPDTGLRRAAVLVPLYQVGEEVFVLLTRRTERVEHHKGQISFPGGAAEDQERDLSRTALRETHEEIGIPPDEVEILGTLGDVEVSVSGFLVTPYVGVIPHPYPLRLNADEIEELLMMPLSAFLDPANLRVERRERNGQAIDIYFYGYGGHTVWGATARIIKQLVDLLALPGPADGSPHVSTAGPKMEAGR